MTVSAPSDAPFATEPVLESDGERGREQPEACQDRRLDGGRSPLAIAPGRRGAAEPQQLAAVLPAASPRPFRPSRPQSRYQTRLARLRSSRNHAVTTARARLVHFSPA